MTLTYTELYQVKLAEGQAFEQHVYDRLLDLCGLDVLPLPDGQHNRGENRAGIEVKYDSKMHRTGNVYLEVAEKAHPTRRAYTPSGIYRPDNTWLWCIGNYQEAFIFGKRQLQRIVEEGDLRFKQTTTSQAYLLPLDRARELAELTLRGT